VCVEGQEELLKVLQELYGSSKTHAQYAGELRGAEGKLRGVEAQKQKAELALGGNKEKIEKSKKIKSLEKDVQRVGNLHYIKRC
jgi:hypothetical protein